jgi:hypothetical protein
VPGEAAVGVDDDLAAGEASVADRPADHEPARGVHVELLAELARVEQVRRQHRQHDLRPQRVRQLGLHAVGVLGGDQHLLDPGGLARVVVPHRDLGLAVRPQVGQFPGVPHAREPLRQPVGERDRGGHELGSLVGGVAEHHALVPGADLVDRVLGPADPAFVPGVDALGDVR